ncbi:hypothetical protein [Pendulispora albinea]|uniref:Uncharacterized protein n=1 Tax=Pendulispora albinea TaxID=2741071 RepID=A0ABZ2LQE6_9BACT
MIAASAFGAPAAIGRLSGAAIAGGLGAIAGARGAAATVRLDGDGGLLAGADIGMGVLAGMGASADIGGASAATDS